MTFHAVIYAAWAISGFHGSPPPIIVDPSVVTNYAEVVDGKVRVSSELYGAATSRNPQARVNAAASLLHEFAHTRQAPDLPAWEVEGGAEAFARDKNWQLLRRFGVLPERWAYTADVHRVFRTLGVWWVRHGQFTSRGEAERKTA